MQNEKRKIFQNERIDDLNNQHIHKRKEKQMIFARFFIFTLYFYLLYFVFTQSLRKSVQFVISV